MYWLEVDFSLFLHLVVFFCCRAGEKNKKTNYRVTMWNECWSCEMSKKNLCQCFFKFFLSFLVFLSCRLPPFLLSHSLTRTNRNASSRQVWKSAGACAISQKKRKKKLSVSSTVLLSPSAALPLPHSLPRSGTCTDGERNSHFSSALLRFFESRRISTGDVETLPLSSSHGEIHDTVTSRQSNWESIMRRLSAP